MPSFSLVLAFKGFNASKFILYLSLLIFVVQLSLKLDEKLIVNYAIVFLPLWICHFIVFMGAFTGITSYVRKPPSSNDSVMQNEFVSMILTTIEHMFLLCFEILVYYKLEHDNVEPKDALIHWSIVFAPVFGLSVFTLIVAVWAMKHEKSFEFEFFYAVNVIEFFFISFKLDQQVNWSWAVVFIPLWIVLSLCAVGVLYSMVLTIVISRSRNFAHSYRRQSCYSAVLHIFLVLPALTCLILLTGKLDSMQWADKEAALNMSYCMALCPLWFSLLCLMLLCFGNDGGNVWWFALRRPFCVFLLDSCPCLRQLANTSYKFGAGENADNEDESETIGREDPERPLRPIVPLTSIECPD
ncbi:unnamed protein product [Auanema sp. JU1783]|nr:unnamed protein product [Auanema sp. JU1783]